MWRQGELGRSRQDGETIPHRKPLLARPHDDLSFARIGVALDVNLYRGTGRTAYDDWTKPACVFAADRNVVTKIRLGNAVLKMSILSCDGYRQRLALTAAIRRDSHTHRRRRDREGIL